MSNVIELASVTKAQRMGPPDGWYEVYQAPKDGRRIRVLVGGGGYGLRELHYDVLWDTQRKRWVYARYRTPLFTWHENIRAWRPITS